MAMAKTISVEKTCFDTFDFPIIMSSEGDGDGDEVDVEAILRNDRDGVDGVDGGSGRVVGCGWNHVLIYSCL